MNRFRFQQGILLSAAEIPAFASGGIFPVSGRVRRVAPVPGGGQGWFVSGSGLMPLGRPHSGEGPFPGNEQKNEQNE